MDSLRLPVFTSIQPLALESAMSTTVRQRACVFSDAVPESLPQPERRSTASLADGHDVRLDAQVVRQLAGIVQGMLRGIGAGKHDAVHMIGTEHVSAQDGDDA